MSKLTQQSNNSDKLKNTIIVNDNVLNEKQTKILIAVVTTLYMGLDVSPNNKDVIDTAKQIFGMVK